VIESYSIVRAAVGLCGIDVVDDDHGCPERRLFQLVGNSEVEKCAGTLLFANELVTLHVLDYGGKNFAVAFGTRQREVRPVNNASKADCGRCLEFNLPGRCFGRRRE
jgi:hypothetical protein